jgi:hypothetical protein
MMKTSRDQHALKEAIAAVFEGKAQQIGSVHVEERPAVIRWVFRCNENEADFNGEEFDATLTVEDMPKVHGAIYVCNAFTLFDGGIKRMTLAHRTFFIRLGYTHAYYKVEGVKKCKHLQSWRCVPVGDAWQG